MDILILDQNFELLTIIDAYESFIWTERYYRYGDFEIYMYFNPNVYPYLQRKNYVMINDSDRVMIIEKVLTETDSDRVTHVTISGRSLESILTRRIVWEETILDGDFQAGIRTLLEKNIISPSIANRKIPNFDFVESNDEKIKDRPIYSYYFGENLYDAIHLACAYRQIGMKVWLENKRFKFQMYTGVDRSYDQDVNPWVVFSPEYDNLESSRYNEDETNFANASLTIGEDTFYIESEDSEGNVKQTEYPQILQEVVLDSSSGLDRREIFTDGSTVNREETTDDGETEIIPEDTYRDLLTSKGKEDLLDYQMKQDVDGQADATRQFIYGRDFKMGDIVQVVNEYGVEIPSRITELIRSYDSQGYKMTPTFVSLTAELDEEGISI